MRGVVFLACVATAAARCCWDDRIFDTDCRRHDKPTCFAGWGLKADDNCNRDDVCYAHTMQECCATGLLAGVLLQALVFIVIIGSVWACAICCCYSPVCCCKADPTVAIYFPLDCSCCGNDGPPKPPLKCFLCCYHDDTADIKADLMR
jgi:hypothetical protein